MGARNARSPSLAIIGFVCVITFAVAGAHAAQTVHGDVAAWNEIHAAFKKLWALSAYRANVTSSYASTVIEIVRPGSYHSVSRETIGTSVQTNEFIYVNGQIRKRTIGAPGVPAEWQCSNDRARSPQSGPSRFDPFDLTASNGTLDVSRGPDTVIDGTPVRTYQYIVTQSDTQSGQTMRTKDTIYVGKASGLPRRIVNASASGNVDGITDFYDYDANIVITLPPCK